MNYVVTVLIELEQQPSRGEYPDMQLRRFTETAISKAVDRINLDMPVGLKLGNAMATDVQRHAKVATREHPPTQADGDGGPV